MSSEKVRLLAGIVVLVVVVLGGIAGIVALSVSIGPSYRLIALAAIPAGALLGLAARRAKNKVSRRVSTAGLFVGIFASTLAANASDAVGLAFVGLCAGVLFFGFPWAQIARDTHAKLSN